MISRLLDLQDRIFRYHTAEDSCDIESFPRIGFSKMGELYEIVFFGEGYDDDPSIKAGDLEEGYNFGFCALLDFLAENSERIASLAFTGPDSGANGTRNWDFTRFLQSAAVFPELLSFKVALTDPGDHNTSIIGESYDENGMVAKLVRKMPKLRHLAVPSAPDQSFFELDDLPIQSLVVQAGYDHQNFIRNLACASNLKALQTLDYSDVFDGSGNLGEDAFTSFEDYRRLFRSEVFSASPHFHFKLRDPRLSDSQLKELAGIRKVQFLHINSNPGIYVKA